MILTNYAVTIIFRMIVISKVLSVVSNHTKSRGMVLCGGNHMVKDALSVIDQTRIIWKSNLLITVAHCGELNDDNIDYLQAINVTVLDICKNSTGSEIFGMSRDHGLKRLKSWFCKTAALILSPYDDTMVVDLDVIWFKNPEVLFDSPAYKQTGSLFFRDKLTHGKMKKVKEGKVFQDYMEDFLTIEGGFNLTSKLAKDQFSSNGISYFWMNLADREKSVYNNFQDSSVILLDRLTHPETLKVLSRLLPKFSIGYGDKEIYWFAATIAREPFSFEPFFCSIYGDCSGLMMHFDPGDILDPSNARAMYINAEWYLSKIKVLGIEYETDLTNPVIVQTNMSADHLYDLKEGKCSCHVSNLGCQPIPSYVNALILRAQWERLTRNKGPCVTIVKDNNTVTDINRALKSMIDDSVCGKYGCAYWPILINETTKSYSNNFCLPISFSPDGPEESLRYVYISVHIPIRICAFF
jgi:hypothetical protein